MIRNTFWINIQSFQLFCLFHNLLALLFIINIFLLLDGNLSQFSLSNTLHFWIKLNIFNFPHFYGFSILTFWLLSLKVNEHWFGWLFWIPQNCWFSLLFLLMNNPLKPPPIFNIYWSRLKIFIYPMFWEINHVIIHINIMTLHNLCYFVFSQIYCKIW